MSLNICVDIDGTITGGYCWLDAANKYFGTSVTEEWFDIHGLPKAKLYLLGSHHKSLKAKELNCHIFIEDRYENAVELSEAGFKVLLVDTNYNRFELNENITRVNNWNDIYKEIIKYQLEQAAVMTHGLKLAVDL